MRDIKINYSSDKKYGILSAVISLIIGLLLFFVSSSLFAQTAFIDNYPTPSIHLSSTDFSLIANGKSIAVTKVADSDYDYAHFSMGAGACTFQVTALGQTSIPSFAINPLNLNIPGSVSGNRLTFTITKDRYIIVWISGKNRRLVIAADPSETDKPASSGTGIFNITQSPYNADKTGATLMTAAIQNAVNAASAYGTGNGTRGIVYVPSGIYKMGNLQLKSNVSLYLEKGAVLRFSENPADYTQNFFKNVWGTWWIHTQEGANNIKVYGRGIIDGNGTYMQKTAKFVNHLLVPLQCSNFTLDGLIMLNPACWGTVPARSNDLVFRNVKFFNSLNLGENDGIDVCESQNVVVQHCIGIGHDDPFSTKTWDLRGDLPKNWYGTPEVLNNVTFDDCVSWTGCVGYKVGAGVRGDQSNITFKNSAIYDCARGLGIDYSYGNHKVDNVTFENIYIQNVDRNCGTGPHWLQFSITNGDGDGGGPVTNVTVKNITIRERGGVPAMLKGYSSTGYFKGVTFENIYVQGNTRPAATLEEMNITDMNEFATDITILPRQNRSTRIQAESYVKHSGITLGDCADLDGGTFIGTKSVNYIVYNNVDFGAETSNIDVRLATMNSGGSIEFRLGSSQGTLLGILNVTSSGGWQTYKTMRLPVTNARGVHTVFMITRKADALGIANINWFELDRTTALATTYNDCNYAGTTVALGAGEYTQSQLLTKGIGDNTISSIKVAPGCVAIGWENNNFQGAAFSTDKDAPCLVSQNFNDRVSSIKVRFLSAAVANGTYRLKNRYSGLYMDVVGASVEEGRNIDQWPGNGQTNQQFTFTNAGSGVYSIIAVNSGRALEVIAGDKTEGAKLVQTTYAGRASQLFYVQSTGDGFYRLIAKHSNKLIEVKDLSKSEGKLLQQWTIGDQLSGQWELIPVTQAVAIFKQGTTAGSSSMANDTALELYPNPVDQVLNITSSLDLSGADVSIVDVMGVEVFSISNINSESLEIAALKAGIYTMIITKDGTKVSKRFMKE